MSWFKRDDNGGIGGSDDGEKTVRTEGLWTKCPGCAQAIFKKIQLFWKRYLEEHPSQEKAA